MRRKMFNEEPPMPESPETERLFPRMDGMSAEEQLQALQEKITRTNKFLHELQSLSAACEQQDEEDIKEKKVFIRRILQVSAELQDSRDVLHALCEPHLTERQLSLVAFQDNIAAADPSLDPSVRFFGIDWEQIYGRCFSVSLNVKIFSQNFLNSAGGDVYIDVLLLNSILKDLGHIEADVTSHAEAVLNGRLSKSQQRLIQEEQLRLNAVQPKPRTSVSKSRSFRDTKKQRQPIKYKKNKTTDFNRVLSPTETTTSIVVTSSADASAPKDMIVEVQQRRKSSFMQNVSSLFKNIR